MPWRRQSVCSASVVARCLSQPFQSAAQFEDASAVSSKGDSPQADVFDRVLMVRLTRRKLRGPARSRPAMTEAVFLDIDSPAAPWRHSELASAVASINERKPVYAFSSASCVPPLLDRQSARAVYATPSARVGPSASCRPWLIIPRARCKGSRWSVSVANTRRWGTGTPSPTTIANSSTPTREIAAEFLRR